MTDQEKPLEVEVMTDPASKGYHVDKRIPLPTLIALGIQTLVFVSLASTYLASVQAQLAAADVRITRLESSPLLQASYQERMVRVETKLDALNDKVDRSLDRSLNRMNR